MLDRNFTLNFTLNARKYSYRHLIKFANSQKTFWCLEGLLLNIKGFLSSFLPKMLFFKKDLNYFKMRFTPLTGQICRKVFGVKNNHLEEIRIIKNSVQTCAWTGHPKSGSYRKLLTFGCMDFNRRLDCFNAMHDSVSL